MWVNENNEMHNLWICYICGNSPACHVVKSKIECVSLQREVFASVELGNKLDQMFEIWFKKSTNIVYAEEEAREP